VQARMRRAEQCAGDSNERTANHASVRNLGGFKARVHRSRDGLAHPPRPVARCRSSCARRCATRPRARTAREHIRSRGWRTRTFAGGALARSSRRSPSAVPRRHRPTFPSMLRVSR
jgi:hypothetical protein